MWQNVTVKLEVICSQLWLRRVIACVANQGRLNAGDACKREVWPGWQVRWRSWQ